MVGLDEGMGVIPQDVHQRVQRPPLALMRWSTRSLGSSITIFIPVGNLG